MASHGPFAIILVLEGNRDMETIPPKKMQVYPEMSKKFCGATALDKSTIVSLSSCQKTGKRAPISCNREHFSSAIDGKRRSLGDA
jgi:hypothetical protein